MDSSSGKLTGQSARDVGQLSIKASDDVTVTVWQEGQGAYLVINLGKDRDGAMAFLPRHAAAYLAGALAVAAGVTFDDG